MRTRHPTRGITLIELLVYIGVFAVVATLAFSAFYQCQKNSRDLRRNTDDILRTLRAGEQWRKDVRAGIAPHVVVVNQQPTEFVIPQKSGTVIYRFEGGTVWRNAGNSTIASLKGVKASRMLLDPRPEANSDACRWEVELASPQPVVKVRPLFSFEAVAKESR